MIFLFASSSSNWNLEILYWVQNFNNIEFNQYLDIAYNIESAHSEIWYISWLMDNQYPDF
jgi:hypothetical protein